MPPARLPRGFAIGGFVVDGWYRDGGMASIYRAHRIADDRRVALKLQLPGATSDPASGERFAREARLMRRVQGSPHVVELLDAGVLDDGRHYLVMEWVQGTNLEELLDSVRNADQRLTLARACRICRDVARGLAELHEHGVLHLDLKPANVMVRAGDDGKDEIKLVDFGIASELRAPAERTEGEACVVMGTSAYMAPEQARGDEPSPGCDVFALGVVSFESISGRSVPPQGWMSEALPRLELLRHGIPAALAELVRACLDVDPQRRPASAQRVASGLVRIIDALEREGARAGAVRVVEGPVRTGATELTPSPAVPGTDGLVEVPVKTGVTEVALTHDVVRELADEVSARADESTPSPTAVESSHSDLEPAKRAWPRWVTLAGVTALAVAGIWLRREGDAAAPTTSPTQSARVERPEGLDGSKHPTTTRGVVASAASEVRTFVPERETSGGERRREAAAESTKTEPARDPCRRKRAEASHAKTERQWRELLRITAPTSCWTGARHRLQRRRLRVEAFAELHAYERCADEGAGGRDDEIRKRVKYCRTKLGWE